MNVGQAEVHAHSGQTKQPDEFRFFPIWPLPTSGMAYAEVVVTVPAGTGGDPNRTDWPLRGSLDWRVPAQVEPGDPVERGVIYSTIAPDRPEWMLETDLDNQRLNFNPLSALKGPVAVKAMTAVTDRAVRH